jgi:hypothetical protein
MLRRIFEPKRDKGAGDWRRAHNEKLHALYSPDINQLIKGRRPLVRPRRRWENNIKMDLQVG